MARQTKSPLFLAPRGRPGARGFPGHAMLQSLDLGENELGNCTGVAEMPSAEEALGFVWGCSG